jgi:hypothetical protein
MDGCRTGLKQVALKVGQLAIALQHPESKAATGTMNTYEVQTV